MRKFQRIMDLLTIKEIDLMPTSGSIISFAQTLPFADKAYIANRFSTSTYKEFRKHCWSWYYLATVDVKR